MPGFLLLQYNNDLRLEKVIAEGGSGIIYEAELLDDNLRRKYRVRKVAVKVMKGFSSYVSLSFLNIPRCREYFRRRKRLASST